MGGCERNIKKLCMNAPLLQDLAIKVDCIESVESLIKFGIF